MCNAHPPASDRSASLHDTLCRVTHGIPCKTAHRIGAALNRLLGRPATAKQCCGHGPTAPAQGPQGGCGGQGGGAGGCGCSGKGAGRQGDS